MKSMSYYNEVDPFAARWLENLILEGVIAYGDVDRRNIEDVRPSELAGYAQCHFFAGIGGWSLALRLAGWPDDRPVWTGSCPCQPFSAAGKGGGFADERHLWPAWFHLIRELRPALIFGEQVASPAALGWFDLVQADMESQAYALASADLCAASVGAPHIRQRLYWLADRLGAGLEIVGEQQARRQCQTVERSGETGVLGDSELPEETRQRQHGRQILSVQEAEGSGLPSRDDGWLMGNTGGGGSGRDSGAVLRAEEEGYFEWRKARGLLDEFELAGFWAGCEWIPCRDGKARPVESGTFPLAHGVPGRVGRLRAYGNAIVPSLGAKFIGAYLDV